MGYKIGTRRDHDVGKRVEIPAHSDLWMRGARFGVVERVVDRTPAPNVIATTMTPERAVIWRVRLDHPQVRRKLFGFYASECRALDGADYQPRRADWPSLPE